MDVNLKTSDSGLTTRINTPNMPIDHVGIIEDIIEVTIGNEIVLKVNWCEDNINVTPTFFIFSGHNKRATITHNCYTTICVQ